MKKDMLRTTIARTLMGLLNLVFYVYIARTIGAAFVGKVSLTILHVSISALVSGILGGSSLVYLVPKTKRASELISLSWVGTFLMPLITLLILLLIRVVTGDMVWIVFCLSVLNIAFQNYMNILLAFEKIWLQNMLSVLQLFLFVSMFLVYYAFIDKFLFFIDPYIAFVITLGISYFVTTFIAFVYIHREIPLGKFTWEDVRSLFLYAFKTQLASLFGLLTYRTVYFFTEKHVGLAAVGFLSIGFQLGEALWILARSIALVQYSKIANMSSVRQALSVTFVLAVVTTFFTLVGGTILYLIPDSFYTFMLGKDFSGIKNVFGIMLPGFTFMACSMIFVHYHSGRGKIERNLLTSFSSFITILFLGKYFMPHFPSWVTAATITSIAYAVHWLLSFIFYWKDVRKNPFSWKEGMHVVFSKKL